jgi:hypothetical protein
MLMRLPFLAVLAALSFTCTGLAGAKADDGKRPFDPASAHARLAGPATRVMVLGTSHLDNAPKSFQPGWLAPVLCRLRAYAPDAILIEAMSGEQLAHLDAFKAVHGIAGRWGGATLDIAKDAQATLGIGPADALAQADVLAAKSSLSPSERRRLAGLFLAAGEPFSAATQWLQLVPADRIADDGVTEKMKKMIELIGAGRGEMSSMAVALAVQLGRSRVYGAGDHVSDHALPDNDAFDAALKANPTIIAGLNKTTPELAPYSSKALAIDAPNRVMPFFRALNSPAFGRLDAQAQWLSLQQSPSMGSVGRQRVAAWEAQNLHMATVVREVTAPIPGGKALLIVGAAHKAFVEVYLRAMTDIEIVSVPAMLDATPAGC